MHGGPNPGGSPKTGRFAKYSRVFGEQFSALVRDPDLLRADAELALYDTFLIERAELLAEGLGAAWCAEVRQAMEALHVAMFVSPDPKKVRVAFDALSALVNAGADRAESWGEILAAAKGRAEIAAKAEANLARREQVVTDRQVLAEFVAMLKIIADVVGDDAARRIQSRWEVERLGRSDAPRNARGVPAGPTGNSRPN